MECIVIIGVLAALGTWAYKSGKRTGSRKGFAAGRRDRK